MINNESFYSLTFWESHHPQISTWKSGPLMSAFSTFTLGLKHINGIGVLRCNLFALFFCFLGLKSEYVNLKESLGAVTQERDLALLERNQLQGKLENLEQVLKVRNTVLIVCQYHSATLPSSGLCGGLTESCEGGAAWSSLHPPDLSLPFSSRFTV